MRHITIISTIIVISNFAMSVQAQQLATISQMSNTQYFFNPAAIAFSEISDYDILLDVDAVSRLQWTSVQGAPKTGMIGLRYQNVEKRISLTALLAHDRFGVSRYTQAQIGFAYQIPFNRFGSSGISMGLYLAGSQYAIDGTQIDVIEAADPLLSGAMQTGVFPAVGGGLFAYHKIDGYHNDSYLFGGISAEQVIPTDVRVEGMNGVEGNLKREPHFHLITGFRKFYSHHDFFEPIIVVSKSFWTPLHINGMIRTTVMGGVTRFGVGLNSEFQYSVELGFKVLDQLIIAYGMSSHLDQTISKQSGLSHQVTVSYQYQN